MEQINDALRSLLVEKKREIEKLESKKRPRGTAIDCGLQHT